MTAMLRASGRNGWLQAAALVLLTTLAFVVIWWRGPDWGQVWDAFRFVVWKLDRPRVPPERRLDAVSRALLAADDRPGAAAQHQRLVHVFLALGVGLFANAIVPGGSESSRASPPSVATSPDAPRGRAPRSSAPSSRTGFSTSSQRRSRRLGAGHGRGPHWAIVALMIVAAVGFALFTIAWLGARRNPGRWCRDRRDGPPPVRDGTERPLGAQRAPLHSPMRSSCSASGG